MMREHGPVQSGHDRRDPISDRPFLRFGKATFAAGASGVVLTVAPPKGQEGVILSMGFGLDPSTWGDFDAAGAVTAGVVLSLFRGGQPFPDLGLMDSPWGYVGDRARCWIPFSSQEPIEVRAQNGHATDSITVCAQLEGSWSSAHGTGGSDGRSLRPWER